MRQIGTAFESQFLDCAIPASHYLRQRGLPLCESHALPLLAIKSPFYSHDIKIRALVPSTHAG